MCVNSSCSGSSLALCKTKGVPILIYQCWFIFIAKAYSYVVAITCMYMYTHRVFICHAVHMNRISYTTTSNNLFILQLAKFDL